MSIQLSRRQFARWAAVAGAYAVVGFDPRSRSWVTRTQAQTRAFHEIPTLDGELLLDDESRKAVAVDKSNLHHKVSAAVLRPGSAQDVVKMVQYANRHSLKVATRGQAHSQYGQTLAEGGIVVDSRSLHAVRVIDSARADVQAGALWADVATATLAKGLTPRVFPATCMALSVGGTLNVGGLGNTSARHGAIVDNVLELDVVTGDGRLITCSPDHDSELFNMVLAGMGQCGIIVGARIPLVPAATHVMLQTLTYATPERYLADQLLVAKDSRFDSQRGNMMRKNGGQWTFAMELGKFFSPPGEPDSASWKSGLRFDSAAAPQRMTYRDYLFRFEARNAAAFSRNVPRVFIAAWIPASATREYLGHLMALTAEQAGFPQAGGIETLSFYPMNSRSFTRPLFKVPAEDQFFTFWIFRSAPAGNDSALAAMIASNRDLLAKMTAAGGKRYTPYGMILSRAEWQAHYGPQLWHRFAEAKRKYDPKQVLSPEPDIFGAAARL
jgi:cytokinin dehydrogenase